MGEGAGSSAETEAHHVGISPQEDQLDAESAMGED